MSKFLTKLFQKKSMLLCTILTASSLEAYNCWEYSCGASFLWMQPRGDGLGYAYVTPLMDSLVDVLPPSGEYSLYTEDPDFCFDWGFSIDARLSAKEKKWGVFGTFTHYLNTADSHVLPGQDTVVVTAWNVPIVHLFDVLAMECGGVWGMHLNQGNVGLYYTFFPLSRLQITPAIAFKGLYLEQGYGSQIFAQTTEGIVTQEAVWENYWAAGGFEPRVMAEWHVGAGFSCFVEGACTLFYGQFRLKGKEDISYPASGTDPSLSELISIQSSDVLFLWNWGAEYRTGINYKIHFCQNRFALDLSAAWQGFYWDNVNHFEQLFRGFYQPSISFLSDFSSGQGSLGLGGISFRAAFSF